MSISKKAAWLQHSIVACEYEQTDIVLKFLAIVVDINIKKNVNNLWNLQNTKNTMYYGEIKSLYCQIIKYMSLLFGCFHI